MRSRALLIIFSLPLIFIFSANAATVDAEAAKTLARQNGCFKCHTVEDNPAKQKDGPAWGKIAGKYRGKSDAEARLITHITTGEKAKFPDGHEEDHKIIKTKDMAQIKNLVNWILSL
ncbi:MAG: c-type cytochrome [Gammaproteobacteria bacterium]|nr:c-type cytochrome [Gammaproteobacteria bacterium]